MDYTELASSEANLDSSVTQEESNYYSSVTTPEHKSEYANEDYTTSSSLHAGDDLTKVLHLSPITFDYGSSNLTQESIEELKRFDGIIIPGGFGSSGVEGKINVIRYCRENNIPFLILKNEMT